MVLTGLRWVIGDLAANVCCSMLSAETICALGTAARCLHPPADSRARQPIAIYATVSFSSGLQCPLFSTSMLASSMSA